MKHRCSLLILALPLFSGCTLESLHVDECGNGLLEGDEMCDGDEIRDNICGDGYQLNDHFSCPQNCQLTEGMKNIYCSPVNGGIVQCKSNIDFPGYTMNASFSLERLNDNVKLYGTITCVDTLTLDQSDIVDFNNVVQNIDNLTLLENNTPSVSISPHTLPGGNYLCFPIVVGINEFNQEGEPVSYKAYNCSPDGQITSAEDTINDLITEKITTNDLDASNDDQYITYINSNYSNCGNGEVEKGELCDIGPDHLPNTEDDIVASHLSCSVYYPIPWAKPDDDPYLPNRSPRCDETCLHLSRGQCDLKPEYVKDGIVSCKSSLVEENGEIIGTMSVHTEYPEIQVQTDIVCYEHDDNQQLFLGNVIDLGNKASALAQSGENIASNHDHIEIRYPASSLPKGIYRCTMFVIGKPNSKGGVTPYKCDPSGEPIDAGQSLQKMLVSLITVEEALEFEYIRK